MRYTNIYGSLMTFIGGMAVTYFTYLPMWAFINNSFTGDMLLLVQLGVIAMYSMILIVIPISIAVKDEEPIGE